MPNPYGSSSGIGVGPAATWHVLRKQDVGANSAIPGEWGPFGAQAVSVPSGPSCYSNGAKIKARVLRRPFGTIVYLHQAIWRPGSLGANLPPCADRQPFGTKALTTHSVPTGHLPELFGCRFFTVAPLELARGHWPLGAGPLANWRQAPGSSCQLAPCPNCLGADSLR